jgi:hypothetical protein
MPRAWWSEHAFQRPSFCDVMRHHGLRFICDGLEADGAGHNGVGRLVRAARLRYAQLVRPGGAALRMGWLFQALARRRHALYSINVGLLDRLGHRFGPAADEVLVAAGEVDAFVGRLYAAAEHSFGREWYFLVLSDHGMTPVTRRVDVLGAVSGTGLRQPGDYLAFVDSTCARFWFETAVAERAIRQTLEELDGIQGLEAQDRLRLRLPSRRGVVGDLLALADSGTLLSPSYYHSESAVKKGMHGYVPSGPFAHAFALLVGPGVGQMRRDDLREVDYAPTLLDIWGLPSLRGIDGRSMLGRCT